MLADQGDYRGAIAEYRAVLTLDPYDTLTHYSFGEALLKVGDGQDAAKEFREANRLDPALKVPKNWGSGSVKSTAKVWPPTGKVNAHTSRFGQVLLVTTKRV